MQNVGKCADVLFKHITQADPAMVPLEKSS